MRLKSVIAERMGEIDAGSTPGEGTMFVLYLTARENREVC